jgi:hypothetical protein
MVEVMLNRGRSERNTGNLQTILYAPTVGTAEGSADAGIRWQPSRQLRA